jgi:hypothetical protein
MSEGGGIMSEGGYFKCRRGGTADFSYLGFNLNYQSMTPCYIITYEVTGPCAINVNNVERTAWEPSPGDPKGRCRVFFKDGKQVLLDEDCEAYNNKAPYCSPERPAGITVYD